MRSIIAVFSFVRTLAAIFFSNAACWSAMTILCEHTCHKGAYETTHDTPLSWSSLACSSEGHSNSSVAIDANGNHVMCALPLMA